MGFAVAAGAIGVVNENKNGLWNRMVAPINAGGTNYIKIEIDFNSSFLLSVGCGSGVSELIYICFINLGSTINKGVKWKRLTVLSPMFEIKLYKDETHIYIEKNFLGGTTSINPLKQGTKNISLTVIQTLPDGVVELPEG